MIDKSAEIRKLLAQGKTSREIASILRVSLRDIHRVRQQEGIDIGALEREKERIEKEIGVLENRIIQMRQERAQLEKQNSTLLRQKHELEVEIERKKTEVIKVVQPLVVERVEIPSNLEELTGYLETLSDDRLIYICKLIRNIGEDRTTRTLRNATARIEQQTRDTLKRSLGKF